MKNKNFKAKAYPRILVRNSIAIKPRVWHTWLLRATNFLLFPLSLALKRTEIETSAGNCWGKTTNEELELKTSINNAVVCAIKNRENQLQCIKIKYMQNSHSSHPSWKRIFVTQTIFSNIFNVIMNFPSFGWIHDFKNLRALKNSVTKSCYNCIYQREKLVYSFNPLHRWRHTHKISAE